MMMMLQKLPTSLMATFKLAVKGIFSMRFGYFTLALFFPPWHLVPTSSNFPIYRALTSYGVDDQLCADHENEKEHKAISRDSL